MPQFFFHLATRQGYFSDDVGVEFETAEAAYLDASRAAIELTIEALRRRESTSDHRFEIVDERGHLLFDVPFNEMVVSRAQTPFGCNLALRAKLAAGVERSRTLQVEVSAAFNQVRESLDVTQALLRKGVRDS